MNKTKEKELRKNNSFIGIFDNFKCTSKHVLGYRKGEREQSHKVFYKIMAENINLHIQEAPQTSNKINVKRLSPINIIVKIIEKILKAGSQK